MNIKGTNTSKKQSPFLRPAYRSGRGDFPEGMPSARAVCLLAINLFISFSLSAQQSSVSQKIIYTGLDNPTSIYATQQHLFVVESGKHRILKLDHNGKLIETLGGLGTGDYQFDTPIDIDATNGLKIYVSDYRNNRVQVFDRRFQYLTTILAPREQRRIRPTQLVVNDFGELFFYDEASKAILKYDENGSFIDSYQINGLKVQELNLKDQSIQLIDYSNMRTGLLSQNGILGEIFPFPVLLIEIIDSVKISGYYFSIQDGTIIKEKDID